MTDYPNKLSDPTVTHWGAYTIEVRTSTHTWGHAANEISGKYDVFKNGNLLLSSSVAGGFSTPEQAGANALRVAKTDARESLDGPFPEFD